MKNNQKRPEVAHSPVAAQKLLNVYAPALQTQVCVATIIFHELVRTGVKNRTSIKLALASQTQH